MIKVTNQEEFEKCLPMLDSPDVECRLLGWELLCGCTNLHRNTLLTWSNVEGISIRYALTHNNEFIYSDHFSSNVIRILYSFLIKEFTIKYKILLPDSHYLKLKYNGHTSQ